MAVSHQLTSNVKLLQKAVLVSRSSFLIVRRAENSKTRPLQWDLPGGNSEWPTSEKEGIIRDLHVQDLEREILEETGIAFDQFITSPQLVSFETIFEVEKQIYTIVVGWKLKLRENFSRESIVLSEEHTEFAWIKPEDVGSYDFGFAGAKEGFISTIIRNSLVRS
jgi:8-oxo-dGTP pyrophosphatase MutT (NUDIX family)